MLVTLQKDSRSSFLGEVEDAAIRQEEEQLRLAGLKTSGFGVEVPYTPQGAAVLAQVLLTWRLARPGRSVTLTLNDKSTVEIGGESSSRIEWLLPVVEVIAIVETRED
jgi:hypothetical protein